jgi:hypothetical protein
MRDFHGEGPREIEADFRYQTYDIGRNILVMILGASCKSSTRRTWRV